MTAPLLLLAISATLAQPARACPAAHVTVEILARQDPVQREIVGLREIEELRDRYGRPVRHRTLGFYASAFFYTVRVAGDGDPADCGDRKMVIELVLSNRRVGMAREAAKLPCLSDVVAQHYQRHVVMDEQAFRRLESRVRDSVSSPGFSASADAAAAQGRSVEDVLRSAVEIELPAYDIDRAEMQAEADDDAEVARIGNACS